MTSNPTTSPLAVCLTLTQAISQASTLDDIYDAALAALARGLAVQRASILLFDPDGTMRFKASRGLSDGYRRAVEGHTPWTPESSNVQPIVVPDVTREPSLRAHLPVIADEGIAAMAFIPLVSLGRVIGKFMLYYERPCTLASEELQFAGIVAAQVAFAVSRTRAEDLARYSEERLRFALEAASMGTFEWDLVSQAARWSDNLERLHGLPQGTFNGTLERYDAAIHPDDRDRVQAAAQRAIAEHSPYDVEYRIVGPDGSVRWVEAKGRVEVVDGRPARMTGVWIMVTPRKEAELARLAASEEANRLKDDFLGVLSHELRTPLNAIVGWVQMIQQGALRSTEQVDHAIEVIGRNARLQTLLIEDILDVTRIAAGKFEIERQPVLVPQVVEAVVTALLPEAEAKRVDVVRETSDGLPAVLGDVKRLHQAIGNVIANAIKFTPEGGRVTVSCTRRDHSIVIAVSDSGVGITPDFLPLVFERFQQGGSRSGPRHGGLGLGLAIARHLVEQHGGSISASSDGPGCGSTFSLTLPTASASSSRLGAHVPPVSQMVRLNGLTVLVVDDVPDSGDLVTAFLKRRGADVIQCGSTAAALSALATTAVDLIVADLGMPDVDGFRMIEQVRAKPPGHHHIPAVAVSALARPEDRDKALAAGYDGYCAKPIELTEFLETIEGVLKRHSETAAGRTA